MGRGLTSGLGEQLWGGAPEASAGLGKNCYEPRLAVFLCWGLTR